MQHSSNCPMQLAHTFLFAARFWLGREIASSIASACSAKPRNNRIYFVFFNIHVYVYIDIHTYIYIYIHHISMGYIYIYRKYILYTDPWQAMRAVGLRESQRRTDEQRTMYKGQKAHAGSFDVRACR